MQLKQLGWTGFCCGITRKKLAPQETENMRERKWWKREWNYEKEEEKAIDK